MKKLIITMGLLCSTAFVATIPLTMISCSSYNGFSVGDVVRIYLVGSGWDYESGTITAIGNSGVTLHNGKFFPWTSIKEMRK